MTDGAYFPSNDNAKNQYHQSYPFLVEQRVHTAYYKLLQMRCPECVRQYYISIRERCLLAKLRQRQSRTFFGSTMAGLSPIPIDYGDYT